MTKRRKTLVLLIGCILLVALVAGGVTLWLVNCTPPDTDPEAPFVDLSDWEKRKVLAAIAAYWEQSETPGLCPDDLFWYGELIKGQEVPLSKYNYYYGVQYYGTFEGYHIVLSPQETMAEESIARTIAGCRFQYPDYFDLFAYKGGKVRPLGEMYEEKLLSDEQIGLIHQCYKRYRQEIYRREAWEENAKNQTNRLPLYVCGAGLVLTGIGSAAVCSESVKKKAQRLYNPSP